MQVPLLYNHNLVSLWAYTNNNKWGLYPSLIINKWRVYSRFQVLNTVQKGLEELVRGEDLAKMSSTTRLDIHLTQVPYWRALIELHLKPLLGTVVH